MCGYSSSKFMLEIMALALSLSLPQSSIDDLVFSVFTSNFF